MLEYEVGKRERQEVAWFEGACQWARCEEGLGRVNGLCPEDLCQGFADVGSVPRLWVLMMTSQGCKVFQ
jgi:hypothetical protein